MDRIAIILAGGKGTRLQPYTIAIPKPLVPVVDKPILEIIIGQLVRKGFGKVIITVNHQADIIMAYFGDGKKWGIEIEYSLEDKSLGTIGPLKLLRDLPENFLVMNGDILSDIDYADFLEKHIKSERIFSIASYKRIQKNDYGVLEIDDDKLIGFQEKPEISFTVSMGIYGVSKKILRYIPADQYFGFDMLMSKFLEMDITVGIYEHKGYWMDIGRPEDYMRVVEDIETGRFTY